MDLFPLYLSVLPLLRLVNNRITSLTGVHHMHQDIWDIIITIPTLISTIHLSYNLPQIIYDLPTAIRTYDPTQYQNASLERYIQFQCAYYTYATLLELPNLFKGRPDMFVHHAISAPLFAIASIYKVAPLALLMTLTTIPSTPFLILAKMTKRLDHPTHNAFGALFAISFFLSRIVAYPILVLYQVFNIQQAQQQQLQSQSTGIIAGQIGGTVIYILQLFWMIKIYRMLTRPKYTSVQVHVHKE